MGERKEEEMEGRVGKERKGRNTTGIHSTFLDFAKSEMTLK
jgi:hypothetical protein